MSPAQSAPRNTHREHPDERGLQRSCPAGNPRPISGGLGARGQPSWAPASLATLPQPLTAGVLGWAVGDWPLWGEHLAPCRGAPPGVGPCGAQSCALLNVLGALPSR